MTKKLGWTARTRQQDGASTEKKIVKARGGRVHPRSGAGKIKWDGSSDTELMEVKDANISHTLQGQLLDALLRKAIQQGKDAVYIVTFKKHRVTATIHLTRSTQ